MVKSYIVDAFTKQVFQGNPAAVMILQKFPANKLMQAIAMENKLSETAFAVAKGNGEYDLRWFTPGGEIDLCGHATLATAFVLSYLNLMPTGEVVFHTKSGPLAVTEENGNFAMDFPAYQLKKVPVTKKMTEAFGRQPQEAYLSRDLLCVFADGTALEDLKPDLVALKELPGLLQHVTVGGKNTPYDCLSRSFAPKLGVDEDPVCGSGHCHIIPYWSQKLNKQKLTAYQASPRSGLLECLNQGDRIRLSGSAVLYSSNEVNLDLK